MELPDGGTDANGATGTGESGEAAATVAATATAAAPPAITTTTKRKRMSSSERLAVRFFKDLDVLLGSLTPDVLRALRPTEVAIFLGSTPLRPKEVFTFALDDAFSSSYHTHDFTAGGSGLTSTRLFVIECVLRLAQLQAAAAAAAAAVAAAAS